jgi:hypothetical protein
VWFNLLPNTPGKEDLLMKRALAVLSAIAFSLLGLASAARPAAGAAPITLPNMVLQVPTNSITIGTDSTTGHRILRYTHINADVGTGPLELDPTENPSTGIATFVQNIYNSPSPGVWAPDHTVPVAATGVFDPPSDYRFPLNSFGLYTVNLDGSLGTQVAVSTKQDFCMTADVMVPNVPNTPSSTYIPFQNCDHPNDPLGWSVGWGDQYDLADPGQPIDLTGVANGTYMLHGAVDPQHVLTESNPNDNVTDTELSITGNSVAVLGQTNPGTTPPTVALTTPVAGATVSGSQTLIATASATAPATISSAQFLLDGNPLGAPVPGPFPGGNGTPQTATFNWTIGSTQPGPHLLSVTVTDSNGSQATALSVAVTVASGGSGPSVDATTTQTGTGAITTVPFSTTGPDVLIALVGSDGSKSPKQTSVVSGGATWTLVQRANADLGTAEIWQATAPAALTNVKVTETPQQGGNFDSELTVLAFKNSGGIGASSIASAATGAPSVALITTAAGSLSYAVGNDWSEPVPRTLATDQTPVAQFVDTPGVNAFWAQTATAPSTSIGQTVTLADTAPTADRFNMAAVEIVPGTTPPPPPPDTTPPTVALTNPTAGQTLTGTVPVAANASDNVAVASVQFLLDGSPLGAAVTTPPYATSWNTTAAANGSHSLAAKAIDTSGNTATTTAISVTVSNPAPPPPACFIMDVNVSAHGKNSATSPTIHDAMAGETLLAFVGADGPSGAGKQTITVSGGGVTWSLVKRANAQSGDAEIWTATAAAQLTNATVTATVSATGFDINLNVIAEQGTSGVGASAIASAATGAPGVSVTTTAAGSLVFAVGNDWTRATARTLAAGQVLVNQLLDTTGDTYWSQVTANPTGAVGTVARDADTAPTTDHYDMVGVELKADPS